MNSSSEAPFPQLRAAYLRAIARSWQDPAYEKKLVDAVDLPRGALDLLEQDFGFHFPFAVRFDIDVQKRPRWEPTTTRGWVGYEDEFTIHLPQSPAKVADRAAILARYLQEFPTLLGNPTRNSGAGAGDAGGPSEVNAASGLSCAGAEVPSSFAEFGVITGRVLALAWTDEAFAERLFDASDARVLIQDVLDYMVPWNFQLRFRLVEEPARDDDAYWKNFPRNRILVHLPKLPHTPCDVDDVALQPIALAAYNDTGDQYPFTCG